MKAKRIDENQPALVKQLRQIPGVTVAHTHMIGEGFGDIIVGFRGKNFLIEIKDPSKPPSKRRLTPDEEKFHNEWTGQIDVAETVSDVLNVINQAK
jgi:hypothetical protein